MGSTPWGQTQVAPLTWFNFFQGREAVMVTFVGTLLVGAVAGWMLEKNIGAPIVRWSRIKRMQMRVLRRQGVSPLRAWRIDEE